MALHKTLRVDDGQSFRLAAHDPADTAGLDSKKEGKERLEKSTARLRELQEMLFAQDRWSVLLIFQAMDAAGKDSTIEHVMSGVNPMGCQVFSFKAPSPEELDHDFMWRTTCRLPERGRIGIFNRSYYEEVLVVRVHPEFLRGQRLPPERVTDAIWEERYESIRDFERHLIRNGTVVVKFFLNVSKQEQKERFLARLDEPEKHWKFAAKDVEERAHWDEYMQAYEACLARTATPEAPWYVIPADHKWFMRMAVAEIVVQRMEALNLHYPTIDAKKKDEVAEARALLDNEAR
ncbi:MAG TPA: polyphosphate kinase 2 family protein [Vicinamibacteria bacterium]|nr:polyphosphate kinase 2 family protein [Vicinamibacteria bacterium]